MNQSTGGWSTCRVAKDSLVPRLISGFIARSMKSGEAERLGTTRLAKESSGSKCVLHIQDLRGQLESALGEVEDLREARERQKEMVEAIVKQRDMYRTLLAQATPLPLESSTPRVGQLLCILVYFPQTSICNNIDTGRIHKCSCV